MAPESEPFVAVPLNVHVLPDTVIVGTAEIPPPPAIYGVLLVAEEVPNMMVAKDGLLESLEILIVAPVVPLPPPNVWMVPIVVQIAAVVNE